LGTAFSQNGTHGRQRTQPWEKNMSAEAVDLMSDGTVTVRGLQIEFGIGRSAAYALMQSGHLPFTTCGRKRLIPRKSVRAMLAENLTLAGQQPAAR
jgi:excisionase family DNA binding protein